MPPSGAYIGLYRENAILQSRVRLATQTAVMCVCFQRRRVRYNENYDRREFARNERNLHCDVHVAAENKHTLPPLWSLDSFWIMRSQRSRRRDKGL